MGLNTIPNGRDAAARLPLSGTPEDRRSQQPVLSGGMDRGTIAERQFQDGFVVALAGTARWDHRVGGKGERLQGTPIPIPQEDLTVIN
jgi:hypothetical protein